MPPLANSTESSGRKEIRRSRSLGTLGCNTRSFATTDTSLSDLTSVDPFFSKNGSKGPHWFEDIVKAERHEASRLTMDPSHRVQFDCFGFSLFDLQADFSDTPVVDPKEAERAARKARRRRSAYTQKSGSSLLHQSHSTRRKCSVGYSRNSNEEVSESRLAECGTKIRRSKSTGDQMHGMHTVKLQKSDSSRLHQSCHSHSTRRRQSDGYVGHSNKQGSESQPEESGTKMRRRKSTGNHIHGVHMVKQPQSQTKDAGGKMRRRQSDGAKEHWGSYSSLLSKKPSASQKRHSGKLSRQTPSANGDARLKKGGILNNSCCANPLAPRTSPSSMEAPAPSKGSRHEHSKHRRRSRSSRRSIVIPKQHTTGKNGSFKTNPHKPDKPDPSSNQNRLTTKEQSRRGRSQLNAAVYPGASKRLVRSGRSLSSLTSLLS